MSILELIENLDRLDVRDLCEILADSRQSEPSIHEVEPSNHETEPLTTEPLKTTPPALPSKKSKSQPRESVSKPVELPALNSDSANKKKDVFINTSWFEISKFKQNAKGEQSPYQRVGLQAKKAPLTRKYIPTYRLIRLVLEYAITHKFKACHLDIDLAGNDLEFEDKNVRYVTDDPVARLQNPQAKNLGKHLIPQPIPGMKGAEKLFHDGFTRFLVNQLGFKDYSGARGVWVYAPQGKTTAIVMIAHDDILIFGKDDQMLRWVESEFANKYVVVNLGLPAFFAGNQIYYKLNKGQVTIDRRQQCFDLCKTHNVKPDPFVDSFFDDDFDYEWRLFGSKQKLSRAERGEKVARFQRIIADLMAISKSFYRDITNMVAKLASLELNVNDFLLEAAERAVNFVSNFCDGELTLGKHPANNSVADVGYVLLHDEDERHRAVVTYSIDRNGQLDFWAKVVNNCDVYLDELAEQMQREVDEDYKYFTMLDHFVSTGQILDPPPKVSVPRLRYEHAEAKINDLPMCNCLSAGSTR